MTSTFIFLTQNNLYESLFSLILLTVLSLLFEMCYCILRPWALFSVRKVFSMITWLLVTKTILYFPSFRISKNGAVAHDFKTSPQNPWEVEFGSFFQFNLWVHQKILPYCCKNVRCRLKTYDLGNDHQNFCHWYRQKDKKRAYVVVPWCTKKWEPSLLRASWYSVWILLCSEEGILQLT